MFLCSWRTEVILITFLSSAIQPWSSCILYEVAWDMAKVLEMLQKVGNSRVQACTKVLLAFLMFVP